MSGARTSLLLLVLPAAVGCASANRRPVRVDLAPARQAIEEAKKAVEEARKAGAAERAAETYKQAQAHLNEAEALALAGGTGAQERAQRAEWMGRLAATEARCATSLTRLTVQASARRASDDQMTARLKRADEERLRLEERIGLLQRDLELTETEVIRTKARLKGIETRAEASSAIAEARILMGRLDAGKADVAALCQQLLAKAEQQLGEENYGAAVFFALKAQTIATKAQSAPSPPTP